jgi:predicted nicotinamide N-methyase
VSEQAAALPRVPGGWTERTFVLGERRVTLDLPAEPDAFLEQPEVLARHARDDYMPYWAHLWPAAIRTAEAIVRFGWTPRGSILELGCGVGLVGIAAAIAGERTGARVTLSDYDAEAVAVAMHNARRNGLSNVTARLLDWREPPGERFRTVIGCDLLYEERDHAPLLDALERLLEPGGLCWLGDPGRTRAIDFWHRAEERGYGIAAFCPESGASIVPAPGSTFVMRLRHSAIAASKTSEESGPG